MGGNIGVRLLYFLISFFLLLYQGQLFADVVFVGLPAALVLIFTLTMDPRA